ncbi:MAG: PAS domain-containing protein [Deltaproteobacteria bacterium]|nr:MAG: PAS domain-containing protein [Deltaproteobacteria bacterium]
MNLSLRARIVLVQLTAVTSVLAFLALVLIPRLEEGARQDRLRELESLARMVAYNAEPAIAFIDAESATEAAETVLVDPEVRRVAIYDLDGNLFALAPRGAEAAPRLPFKPARDTMVVQGPIGREGDWVGAVVLEVGTEEIRAQSTSIRRSAALAAGLGLVLALVLASAMEGLVSRRILALSNVIEQAHHHPDTKARVPVTQGRMDEVGELSLRVNELLDAIDLREAQLLATHQKLEQRVADRTSELEATTHRTTAILQSLMDGLVVVDRSHKVISANEAMVRMVGRDPMGEPLKNFMRPKEGDADERLDRDVGQVGQWWLHTRTDDRLPVEVSIALIAGQGNLQTVISVRDISERLRLDQLKADFVSTVSHELRTPITAVYGSLRLVLNGVTGPISDTAQSMLQRAFDNSERLIRLVNDLLDMQRVERGQLVISPEPTRLDRLVTAAIDSSEGYDSRRIPIVLESSDEAIWVNADSDRIIQVLHNFLSNALKYSPDDGRITVRMLCQPERVRVEVQDEGPGIPESFRKRMFGAFQQAESGPERRKPGTGLGLAVSKAIVDGHQGTIGYLCPDEGGTVLWFELVRLEVAMSAGGNGPAA